MYICCCISSLYSSVILKVLPFFVSPISMEVTWFCKKPHAGQGSGALVKLEGKFFLPLRWNGIGRKLNKVRETRHVRGEKVVKLFEFWVCLGVTTSWKNKAICISNISSVFIILNCFVLNGCLHEVGWSVIKAKLLPRKPYPTLIYNQGENVMKN